MAWAEESEYKEMSSYKKKHISNEEYLYSAIREKIRTGEYAPGHPLKEQELSEKYKFSRTPVRAALKQLSYDGMVHIIPRVGAQVRHITPEEAYDLLEVREVIDGLAARLAAEKISPEWMKQLDYIFEQMERSINENRLAEYIKLNDSLHCCIAEISGNFKVNEIIQLTSIRLMRIQFQDILLNSRARQSFEEHKHLLSLIKNKKPEEAEKAARKHVAHVIETVKDLEQKQIYYF